MNDYQIKWLEALRSNKYKQGKHVLHNIKRDSYCCLGVACEIFLNDDDKLGLTESGSQIFKNLNGSGFSGYSTYTCLPTQLAKKLEISVVGTFKNMVYIGLNRYASITEINDSDSGFSFTEIANIIEEQLKLNNFSKLERKN